MKANKIAEVEVTYKRTASRRIKITKPQDAELFLRSVWSNQMEYREEMYVLLLNRANDVIGYNCLSKGGTAGTVVDTKMILQIAIKTNSHGLILAHNHPSGNTKSSEQDLKLTSRVKIASALFEVKLLDHLVLTPGSYLSMADEGLL